MFGKKDVKEVPKGADNATKLLKGLKTTTKEATVKLT
jgi:hypothetical protein